MMPLSDRHACYVIALTTVPVTDTRAATLPSPYSETLNQSSEFQLRLSLHDDAINTVLRNMELPILDNGPSQSPKTQPHHTQLVRPQH
ncbi:hypothetical protein BDR07DRAFT_1411382 [Suillus spraguei]|nr:hypothetical protein BDR07DRAFT_1439600 [Suillus spraguei]KAG2360875.1 hypothetical protein BDR07DRAFT_1411382 [Suillus spraguei]